MLCADDVITHLRELLMELKCDTSECYTCGWIDRSEAFERRASTKSRLKCSKCLAINRNTAAEVDEGAAEADEGDEDSTEAEESDEGNADEKNDAIAGDAAPDEEESNTSKCAVCENTREWLSACAHCSALVCYTCQSKGTDVWGVSIDLKCARCSAVLCNKCINYCRDCSADNGNVKSYCSDCTPKSYMSIVGCEQHSWLCCAKHISATNKDGRCDECDWLDNYWGRHCD